MFLLQNNAFKTYRVVFGNFVQYKIHNSENCNKSQMKAKK